MGRTVDAAPDGIPCDSRVHRGLRGELEQILRCVGAKRCSAAAGPAPRVRSVRSGPQDGPSQPEKKGPPPMPVTEDEKAAKARDAALQGALTQIERQFGKGTVMRMGDEGAKVSVGAIPTGALSLDLALGIGGVPRGRIVEVFGPESSGKTTLDVPHHRRGPEARRRVRVHRRRARDGPALRAGDRRRHRRAARLAARLRRAGARDRRHARALRRGRRDRGRLGRRAHAAGRARGPDGRPDASACRRG